MASSNESSSLDATEVLKEEIENKVISADDANPVGLKFKVGKSVGNFTEEDLELDLFTDEESYDYLLDNLSEMDLYDLQDL